MIPPQMAQSNMIFAMFNVSSWYQGVLPYWLRSAGARVRTRLSSGPGSVSCPPFFRSLQAYPLHHFRSFQVQIIFVLAMDQVWD